MTTQNFRVYAYLRASTKEQDATRAKTKIENFAKEKNIEISKFFIENASGRTLDRKELMSLIDVAMPGDVLLCENLDRVSRLCKGKWVELLDLLRKKRIYIVAVLVPMTYYFLSNDFRKNISKFDIMEMFANFILEVMAAQAHEEDEIRKERQAQGIAKKKVAGGWKGRGMTQRIKEKLPTIIFMLQEGVSQRKIAVALGVGIVKINKINKEYISTTVTVKQKSIN